MAITAKGEVLRPGNTWKQRAAASAFNDEHLDLLSHLLDDFIRIPGTPIRFGLNGIVGFIPGVGDILGGLASTIIILAAWMRGVSKATLARMVLNVGIETVAGSVPLVGNLFDIGWRANRRNYALLTRSLEQPERAERGNWLFLVGICVVLLALILIPVLLAALLVVEIHRHW